MKLRNGFVSNSSSSSFIVGIAEIVDMAKFESYVEKHKIIFDRDGYVINEGSINNDCWDLRLTNDKIVVESFETSVSVDRKKPLTMFFVVNISNNEGDGSFWNEEYCEMNYDIDIDYFDEDQQKSYNAFFDKDSGLNMENDVRYGAARNG